MTNYLLLQEAEFDLHDIWHYIAKDSPNRADQWIDKLYNSFEALGRMPGMGHLREDLTHLPLLFWPVGSYFVIYRVIDKKVEIHGVVHSARDIPSLLKRRLSH